MIDPDDELDLQNLWQTSAPVDVTALVESVTKAQKRMRYYFYYELGSSLIGFAFLGWLSVKQVFGDQWWPLLLIGVLAGAGQFWTWTWRRGLWNAFAKSPAELLELRRKHLLLDIKIGRSCSWGVVIGMVVGLTMKLFIHDENPSGLEDSTRYLILALALAMVSFFFVWGVLKELRARKMLKKLDIQIEEFNREENL